MSGARGKSDGGSYDASPDLTERNTSMTGQENRPKVLFIAHTGGIAGAERVLISIVSFLQQTSFRTIVVVPENGDLKRELELSGASVLVAPIEWWIPRETSSKRWHLRAYLEGLPDRVRTVVKIIHEQNIHIVHSNVGVALEGALAAKLTKRPHIWHQHSTFRGDKHLKPWVPYSLIPYIFYALSDKILCCSHFTVQELFPSHLRRNVKVFYNGIDVERLTPGPSKNDLRLELGLPPETPLVGLLGTVYERKGQLEFVEAAARVRQVTPNAHFIFAGGDPPPRTYLQEVCQRIDDLNARDYIHYLGYRLDYVDIMKSLDVYVLASKLEMLPLVVLEAMACGKPVVATRCGGSTEAVVDEVTGLLVDVADVEQLAHGIVRLLSRPDRGALLGHRGRERVAAVFDQRKCLSALPRTYQELLERTCSKEERIHDQSRIVPFLISLFLKLCAYVPSTYDAIRRKMKKVGFPIPEHIKLD